MLKNGERSIWIDSIKIFACILVVLGHFFQSMVAADILSSSALYGWFNQTIYYFHVPLFFICSGYLYQKTAQVRGLSQWMFSVAKKGIALGVPYFFFSFVTWFFKSVFASSVNERAGGLSETLFVSPLSPYWYLYALFLLFCVTITIRSKKEAAALALVAIVMKAISFVWTSDIPAVDYLLENEIWFASGVIISFFDIQTIFQKIKTFWAVLVSVLFFLSSIVVYFYTDRSDVMSFLMGVFGCISVLLVAIKTAKSSFVNKGAPVLAKYTFPVFLMHTIFAAGTRVFLVKVGILDPVIHVALGLTMSCAGPVLADVFMKKVKWIAFLLYPNTLIKIGKK